MLKVCSQELKSQLLGSSGHGTQRSNGKSHFTTNYDPATGALVLIDHAGAIIDAVNQNVLDLVELRAI